MQTQLQPSRFLALPRRTPALAFGVLGLGLLGGFLADLMLGSVAIPASAVLDILLGEPAGQAAWGPIVLKLRLPRAITAICAGSALAAGGLMMQTLFRNPLAGPYILGITSGASLGVAAVMLGAGGGAGISLYLLREMGLGGSFLLLGAALIGALLVLLIVVGVAARVHDKIVLLIIGLMLGHLTLALVSLWQFFSRPETIKEYLLWTFGSLGGVTPPYLWVLLGAVALGLLGCFGLAKGLDLLLLGEAYATSLGLHVRRNRILIIAVTSLLAASVTAFCGPIGFVGVAVPHLARGLLGRAEHRLLIPASVLMGAVLMLACDLIARVPGSASALPINAVTALVGSPIVIGVILRQSTLRKAFA
jgi:iron complex transport system permease protein